MDIKERWRRMQRECGFRRPGSEPEASERDRRRQVWEDYRRLREASRPAALTSSFGTYTSGIDGREQETPFGTCFHRDTWLGDEPRYNWDALTQLPARLFHPHPTANPGLLHEWVFLDVETTGLGGGVGTLAFMVGLAWWEDGGLSVRQYFLRDIDEEPAMLWALGDLLHNFRGMITFNGRAFDRHVLQNRLTLNRMDFDLMTYPHLDLYHWCRRIWQGRWPSVTLQAMEERLLGWQRTLDIRGSEIPAVFRWYLRNGWHQALYLVFEHNVRDLSSLAVLAVRLGRALAGEQSALDDGDYGFLAWHQGKLWQARDWRFTLQLWHPLLTRDLVPPKLRSRVVVHGLRLIRRRGAWTHLPDWLERLETLPAGSLLPRAWSLAAFYAYRFHRTPALAVKFLDTALEHPAAAPDLRERLERRRRRLLERRVRRLRKGP